MASSPRARSNGPIVHETGGFSRSSTSPTGRLFSGAGGRRSSSSAFSPSPSYTSNFLHHKHHSTASPARFNLIAAKRGSISAASASAPPRRTCMCSPTTHPGSFRCSLHKRLASPSGTAGHPSVSSPSNRLNARRSAMTNSLVRIGTVEGELGKRALAALIRPSSHQQRRRAGFQARPSRLSVMSKAGDL